MIERVAWADHMAHMRANWRQGEHITGVGHNGCGKSNLMRNLLPLRSFVCAIGTKPTTRDRLDPVLAALARVDGYEVRDELPDIGPGHRERRVLVWPRYRGIGDKPAQREAIARTLSDAFTDGGWCVPVDEVAYLARQLRLSDVLVHLLTQGRSQKVSLCGFTQRPSHIPLEFYTEPAHLYAWRTRNPNDLRRLSALSGAMDVRAVAAELVNLPKHHVLYCQLHTGDMHVTMAPLLPTR